MRDFKGLARGPINYAMPNGPVGEPDDADWEDERPRRPAPTPVMREAALARSIDKLREVDASLAYAKAWAAANPR